jgi:AcrR family transcriptional regulator
MGGLGMNEADPRVRRTRKLIVDAFLALLAERGFRAVNVQDIAERATAPA